MQRLDRMEWAAGLSFNTYGRRVGIRVNDRDVLPQLSRHLPFGWKPAAEPVVERLYSLRVDSRPRRSHLLYLNADRLAYGKDLEHIFDALESDLQYYTAEWARHRVFVHAGVVGWRGKAIVIPGPSYAGKSTLVRELVRAGATYYSDEYAVFDSRGRVHPYAKPVSIRENGDAGKQTHYAVETFGGRPGASSLPVGLIVSTGYRLGARWNARLLTPGQAALELLANTVAVRRQPEKTLATLRAAVGTATALKTRRDEARSVAKSLLALADSGNSSFQALLDREGRIIRRLDAIERQVGAARPPEPAPKSLAGSRILRDGLKAGTLAPAFRLPDTHGGTVSLDRYRGRRLLLIFSDPHCGPCNSLAPKLARFHAKHEGAGLELLIVSRGDVEENRVKAEMHKIRFPVALQDKWKLSKEYGIFSTPVAFLIGKDGVIERNVGIGREAIMDLAREGIKVRKEAPTGGNLLGMTG